MKMQSPSSPGDSGYITQSPASNTPRTRSNRQSARLRNSYRIDPLDTPRAQRARRRAKLSESSSVDFEDEGLPDGFSMRLRSRHIFGSVSTPPSPQLGDVPEITKLVAQSTPWEKEKYESPTTSQLESTSQERRNLNRLRISERVVPKALNFELSNAARAIPDVTGRENLDILTMLGEKSNHWKIVSKIFDHLLPQDLCAFSMVCKSWHRLCKSNVDANVRRLTHVIACQSVKENLGKVRKSKLEEPKTPSGLKMKHRKNMPLQVRNLLGTPRKVAPVSPPVSPSKRKFHSYVKASRSLAPGGHLLPCPKCSFASRVDTESNIGFCSRKNCLLEFCISCLANSHEGSCSTPLLATPTKKHKKQLVFGTRQSKRNLRRL